MLILLHITGWQNKKRNKMILKSSDSSNNLCAWTQNSLIVEALPLQSGLFHHSSIEKYHIIVRWRQYSIQSSYSWPTISDGCRRMLSSKKDVPTLRHFHNLTVRKSPTIPFQLATLRITDKRTLFFLGSADLKTINLKKIICRRQ